MKHKFLRLIATALLAGLLTSTNALADDLLARFSALPAIWTAAISPDGKNLALGCSRQGVLAVCVAQIDGTGRAAKVFMPEPNQSIVGVSWGGPDWVVLNVQSVDDLRGVTEAMRYLEVTRAVANNVRTGEASMVMSNSDFGLNTNLTQIARAPASMADELLIRVWDYRKTEQALPGRITQQKNSGTSHVALYSVDLKTGRGKEFHPGNSYTRGYLVANNGETILRLDVPPGKLTVNHTTDSGSEAIAEFPFDYEKDRWWPEGIFLDGKKLALSGDFGDEVRGLQTYDLGTKKREPVEPGTPGVTPESWILDESSEAVVGFRDVLYNQHFVDPALERVRAALSKTLSQQSVTLLSWSQDRSMIVVDARTAGQPATLYLFDLKAKSLSPIGEEFAQLHGMTLATPKRLQYAARDGLKIEAYLTLPPGKSEKDGPFPLLLMPHGGPRAHDDASFDWWRSYYAQRGYAVLQPNFRGSSGYGYAFVQKGFGEFGGAMVDDVIDGARYLISTGVVAAGRVCAMGASYGGYSALMIAIRNPQIARCVIAWAPVTDPMSLIADRMKRFKRNSGSGVIEFWDDYIGKDLDPAQSAAISPAQRASALKVPVLLLHGTLDSTVPFTQALNLKRQLQESGGDLHFVEVQGNDHQLRTAAARKTLLTEIDAFLEKNLPLSK